jgi:long-chain acyl-CoA synthetase
MPGRNQEGTVGPPYDGVEQRIDPQTGEIQVRSPSLLRGYYKEPEKTSEVLTKDGWLRTGDKGQIDGEGRLRITGRVKDLFKTSKGKYVAPAPIEDKLVMHESVEACVVTGANLGQPLGIVMLNPEAMKRVGDPGWRGKLEASLVNHVRGINATLDPHENLQCVVIAKEAWTVDNGVVTPTFKVKRNRIDEIYGKHYDAWEKSRKSVVWES